MLLWQRTCQYNVYLTVDRSLETNNKKLRILRIGISTSDFISNVLFKVFIMSSTNKASPKIYCDRYRRHCQAFNSFDKNAFRTVKKVIVSKQICSSRGEKSFSTGVLSSCRNGQVTTPRKTAQSDVVFDQNHICNTKIDFCKNCGDVASHTEINSEACASKSKHKQKALCKPSSSQATPRLTSGNIKTSVKNVENKLHQYYKNEKFHESTDSIYGPDNIRKTSKASLNTIIEHPEQLSDEESTIFEIYPEKDEELGFMDPNDRETIEKLKQFRKKNYFECHSVKSRIYSKGSVTSLKNHKCVYRFYLNDRLFPVPLNTDHEENIRCIECHLPFERDDPSSHINGTVQAKVKLNGEIQDMLLMLPVKNSLIVKERRKVLPVKKEHDSLYFGIIKLDLNGDSKFNRNIPSDSLALRYQKGFKELSVNKKYEYDCITKDDIIII